MSALGELSAHVLTGPGPSDPQRLLSFVGAHAVPGIEVWDGRTYARTLDLPGGPAVVAVSSTPQPGGYAVTLRLTDPVDGPVALGRLRHLLALDVDPTMAERQLLADPLMAALVAARSGLRPPGSADHAETLIRTVIGQQVSLAGARSLGARLVAQHGTPLPARWRSLSPGLSHLWPRARTLAALEPTDPALAMPTARARTVVAAARAVVAVGDGHPPSPAEDRQPPAPAEIQLPPTADLLALPGIGPWTADYVDLRCRADPDVFLPDDLAVRRALDRLGAPSTPRLVGELAARWSPYRSVALMHLWAAYLNL